MTGRVLVVDDVVQNVKLLEVKLATEYYTVFPAYSGMEALEKVKDISPDIILLDIMMPEMDGFEVCKRLKEDPDTMHIPVVMVTALSEMEDRVRGLEAGANDFITKPIDEVHLFARVKSLIRLKVLIDELRMRDKTGIQLGVVESNFSEIERQLTGNIIIIDDDLVQSRRIQESLKMNGYTSEIEEPEDAIIATEDGSFDLAIISTMLDDDDGLRLGMQIRSQEKNRQIPIMILIDEDDRKLLAKGLEIGVDDYLITPVDPNELIARVNTQIRRKRYQETLKLNYEESISASVVDSLTKLYNRRYLDAHLANMVKDALERHSPLSLMILDIDHFKNVNDKPGWGHHIGDEVLKQVAERITQSVRTTDLATRPGGEEFVVVMPNTEMHRAIKVAERARSNMANTKFTISAEPGDLVCTVSIGVSKIESGDTAEELLKRADAALFKAKNSGRNQVVVAESSDSV